MPCKLTDFLTRLAYDKQLCEAFKNDKVGTMKAHDVSDMHIQMIIENRYHELQETIGFNYTIATDHIIKAFKVNEQLLKAS